MGEEKKRHRAAQSAPEMEPASEVESMPGQEIPSPEAVPAQNQELEALKAELETVKAKSADYFDGWQRERADFANYKRRIDRDQSQLSQNLTGAIGRKYLAVIDDMERALKARPNGGEGGAWADGVELIYRKLQNILESEGIQRMAAEKETFDPNRHEAISHEDSPDHQSGEIIEVVQPGYLMGDRVLRPALVRVAR